eukprot:TRINITY_DN5452_c0_g4_i1.p1 TRINITY_DN5452_c0_g4~~TRINITY_DN5452_c0_g4_i1.p1  ORF type:complete len:1330 (-),score=514.18 TRINITY_DN5452_c0_g4_i1:27-4016(-)
MGNKERIQWMREHMAEILGEAQKTLAVHKRCADNMLSLYRRDYKTFRSEFERIIKGVVGKGEKREDSITRIIQFIADTVTFISSKSQETSELSKSTPKKSPKKKTKPQKGKSKKKADDSDEESDEMEMDKVQDDDDKPPKDDDLTKDIIELLLKFTNVANKGIRWRSCEIIAALMKRMNESIEDDLSREIESTMKQSMKDKDSNVRCQAVLALSRLQEPSDPDDKIIKRYLKIMTSDVSAEVRKAVVDTVKSSKITIPALLERMRDTSVSVRKSVAVKIGNGVPVKKLTLEQRLEFVKNGLEDEQITVKKATISAICNHWLKEMGGSIPELLKLMDVCNNVHLCQMMTHYLLMELDKYKFEFSEEFMKNLTKETAFEWRMNCNHARVVLKNDDLFDSLLPETVPFCRVLTQHLKGEYEGDLFIAEQLLMISGQMDFADEGGRKIFVSCCHSVLSKDLEITESIAEIMIKLIFKISSDEEFLKFALEVISDLKDPLEEKERTDEEESIVMTRCLMICRLFFEKSKFAKRVGLKDPRIYGFLPNVILVGIQSKEERVRAAAVPCLGHICLLDRTEALKYRLLLIEILTKDTEEIQTEALKVLFDLIVYYGLKLFIGEEGLEEVLSQDASQYLSQGPIEKGSKEYDRSIHEALALVSKFWNSSEKKLQDICIKGLCKLMLIDELSIYRDQILSKLILSHQTPEGPNLEKITDATFSSQKRRSGEISSALLYALKTIALAIRGTKMANLNMVDLVEFHLKFLDASQKVEFAKKILVSMCQKKYNGKMGALSIVLSALIPSVTALGDKETNKQLNWITKKVDPLKSPIDRKHFEKWQKYIAGSFDKNSKMSEASIKSLMEEINEGELKEVEDPIEDEPPRNLSSQEKKQSMIEKQKSYFDSVDDFQLEETPNNSKKKNLPKVQPGPVGSWGKVNKELKDRNSELERKVAELQRQLAQNEISDKKKKPIQRVEIEDPVLSDDEEEKTKEKLEEKKRKANETKPSTPAKVQRTEQTKEAPTVEKKNEKIVAPKRSQVTPKTTTTPPDSMDISNSQKEDISGKSTKSTNNTTKNATTEAKSNGKRKQVEVITIQDEEKPKTNPKTPEKESYSQKKAKTSPGGIPDTSTLIPSPPVVMKTKKPAIEHSSVKRVVVAFSGFKEGEKIFNLNLRNDLADRILLLGGEAVLDDAFDAKISHIITAGPTVRTMKSMAACLTGRWLLLHHWVLESSSAGYFVDETPFGIKRTNPFGKKQVFLSPEFLTESSKKNFTKGNYVTLIERLGKGRIVEKREDADIVVISSSQSATAQEKEKGTTVLNWVTFFTLIQGESSDFKYNQK